MNCDSCGECLFLEFDSFDGICCLFDEYISQMQTCPLDGDA